MENVMTETTTPETVTPIETNDTPLGVATDELLAEMADFALNSEKHLKGNKSAGLRARKALGNIKKLVTPYRKLSVAE